MPQCRNVESNTSSGVRHIGADARRDYQDSSKQIVDRHDRDRAEVEGADAGLDGAAIADDHHRHLVGLDVLCGRALHVRGRQAGDRRHDPLNVSSGKPQTTSSSSLRARSPVISNSPGNANAT